MKKINITYAIYHAYGIQSNSSTSGSYNHSAVESVGIGHPKVTYYLHLNLLYISEIASVYFKKAFYDKV